MSWKTIRSGRLAWNLYIQITHLQGNMIFQTSMIIFYVNLPGCLPFELRASLGGMKLLPFKGWMHFGSVELTENAAISKIDQCLQWMMQLNFQHPRCLMYGLFTYIWVVWGPNVGKIRQSHPSHFLGMQGFPWSVLLIPQPKSVNFFNLGDLPRLLTTPEGTVKLSPGIC